MSKVVKKIGRSIKKVVKGVARGVKKVWKKIKQSKVLKVIAIAALIYFGGAALMGGIGGAAGGGGVNTSTATSLELHLGADCLEVGAG